MVLCAQEDKSSLDLDSTLPQDAASRGLRGGRSQRTDVSLFVGGHSSSLSGRTLLHRFLEGLPDRHSRRAAHSCGKGNWGNRSCGALEYHVAATVGSVRAQDALFLQIFAHAHGVSEPLSASLPP